MHIDDAPANGMHWMQLIANNQGTRMNQQRLAGICRQLGGRAKSSWGNFTGNPFAVAAGARDQLAGRIQERHGASKERAARELADFFKRNRNWYPSGR
jgi:uncharacterized protein YjbJ (UPF0337 family)